MNQILRFLLFIVPITVSGQYDDNTTLNYSELIEVYTKLAAEHEEISLFEMGQSDYGLPIYLCVLNGEKDSLATFQKAQSQTTILINNAIHPGEPDGVNACLNMIETWIENGKFKVNLPVIAIIPAYNVGGMMNRSGTSRANQDGPEEYGFRGNMKNLDLNRDCVKMDSKNMFTFATIFQALDPDVFLDTHVSNGADYQYTMTYIASIRERMAPELGALMHDELIPTLKKRSQKKGYDLIPYVDTKGETPETGIVGFNDLPRYIMGYASMMNAMSFTLETHMLKPFPERVKATEVFLLETIGWMMDNSPEIEDARDKARKWEQNLKTFKFNYQLTDEFDSLEFKGYEFSHPISEVTGLKRLKYHRDRPFVRKIPFYHFFKAQDSVAIPQYFIIERQNNSIIERLKANGFIIQPLKNDTIIRATITKIESFQSMKVPYEGHFSHSNIHRNEYQENTVFKRGDVVVKTNQKNKRFLMSIMECSTADSYFAWNFFDSYLQQKEYFSPYIFEDEALEMLNNDPELRKEFNEKKKNDEAFRTSSWAQLYFIYKRSELYEPTHNRLPVFKVY